VKHHGFILFLLSNGEPSLFAQVMARSVNPDVKAPNFGADGELVAFFRWDHPPEQW
jgi:hypothetical protein